MLNKITTEELNKFIEAIKQESTFDGYVLKLGKLLEIKPVYTRNLQKPNGQKLIGYDIYKYADEELMEDEDYDFDSDFITTVYLK